MCGFGNLDSQTSVRVHMAAFSRDERPCCSPRTNDDTSLPVVAGSSYALTLLCLPKMEPSVTMIAGPHCLRVVAYLSYCPIVSSTLLALRRSYQSFPIFPTDCQYCTSTSNNLIRLDGGAGEFAALGSLAPF
jgi:hypothetical protein